MRREYPDEFEAFSEALNRERYLYGSGRKPRPSLEPIYDRYGYLFRREEIDELRADASGAYLERDRKAARYLLAAAVSHHGEALARPLTEEIAWHGATAAVRPAGREIALNAVPALAAAEPRPAPRHELEARRDRVVEETNDLRAERFEKLRDAATELGASSRGALLSEARGVDYAALASASGGLLSTTERAYADALEPALAARAGVRLSEATPADALRAFRLAEYDRGLPSRRLPSVYRDALAGLGVRAGRQTNLALDLDDRPAKRPDSFCAPIRVPDRVVLVVRPQGGYPDYLSLMREAGRGQLYAFTSPEVRTAFSRAGDGATPELFAELFANLVRDPEWTAERTEVGRDRAFAAVAALDRCHAARRLAAISAYEEELLSGRLSLAGAPARYEEALAEATRVRTGRAGYLAAVDLAFGAADRLRGWAVEVALRDHLKTRFGGRWWASRGAGELLKEIWSTGNEYSADEIAAELRLGPVSLDPLEAELLAGLAP